MAACVVQPWGVVQLVEHRTGTPLTQVRLPITARDFSHSHLSVQTLLRCPYTPVCNRMHLYLCARPLVHVRVRWIMETLKHPACTVGWEARLSRSWLSPGDDIPNFPREKSRWDNTAAKRGGRRRKRKGDTSTKGTQLIAETSLQVCTFQ